MTILEKERKTTMRILFVSMFVLASCLGDSDRNVLEGSTLESCQNNRDDDTDGFADCDDQGCCPYSVCSSFDVCAPGAPVQGSGTSMDGAVPRDSALTRQDIGTDFSEKPSVDGNSMPVDSGVENPFVPDAGIPDVSIIPDVSELIPDAGSLSDVGSPFDAGSTPDGDEYPFGEICVVVGSVNDWDGDGIENSEEYTLGMDPCLADTDGDGILDPDDQYPLGDEIGSGGSCLLEQVGRTVELRNGQGFLRFPFRVPARIGNAWDYSSGSASPFNNGGRLEYSHRAIDYLVNGGTEVVAACSGWAMADRQSGEGETYGKLILLRCDQTVEDVSGNPHAVFVLYAHLSDYSSLVPYQSGQRGNFGTSWSTLGAWVSVGTSLGFSGKSGTSWYHTHFQVFLDDYMYYLTRVIDPYDIRARTNALRCHSARWYPGNVHSCDFTRCGPQSLWQECPSVASCVSTGCERANAGTGNRYNLETRRWDAESAPGAYVPNADEYSEACGTERNCPFGYSICSSLPAENCSNGVDDNGNGLVDCQEQICIGDIHCAPVIDSVFCDSNTQGDSATCWFDGSNFLSTDRVWLSCFNISSSRLVSSERIELTGHWSCVCAPGSQFASYRHPLMPIDRDEPRYVSRLNNSVNLIDDCDGRDCGFSACGDSCGNCVAPPHMLSECYSGHCRFSCDSGYNDCDSNASNGCERVGSCSGCPECQTWNGSSCVSISNGTTCSSDSNSCTNDACSGGACAHTTISCDDSSSCTTDSCTPASGCLYTSIVCSSPPVPVCVSGNSRICSLPGRCEVGSCAYNCADTSCAHGCDTVNGLCRDCTPNWECSGWSGCSCSGTRTRTCLDINLCGVTTGRPALSEACFSCGNGICDCSETCATCLSDCPVNFTNDVDNCGSCGNVCPTRAHASRICSASVCSFSCDSGYNDCDSNASNGCERAGSCSDCPECQTWNGSSCVSVSNGTACSSDSNSCTNDACSGGACAHTTISCDDSNSCTTDSCNTASGCAHIAVGCDDGNACTTDSCTSTEGCLYTSIVCNSPPGPVCANSNTSRQYSGTGSCSSGICGSYPYLDSNCPAGCDSATGLCRSESIPSAPVMTAPADEHVSTYAVGSTGSASIRWGRVTDAAGYEVEVRYRIGIGRGTYIDGTSTSITSWTFRHDSDIFGVELATRVRAVNSSGTFGPWSAQRSFFLSYYVGTVVQCSSGCPTGTSGAWYRISSDIQPEDTAIRPRELIMDWINLTCSAGYTVQSIPFSAMSWYSRNAARYGGCPPNP